MSGSESGLLIAVFLACAVESVEALTIILAVGIERGWRSALLGAGTGLVVLGALVAILGPAIRSVPLGALRVAVGALLLVYGLQWLHKAILRGAGRKALHDETALFAQYSADARSAVDVGPAAGREHVDGYAFSAAAKAVLLEGMEVVFIVISFGSGAHDIGGAAVAAGAAAVLVAGVGIAVRAPLSRVPENTMKLAVGVLLCAFGIFWATGAGAHWPGGDAALLVLVPGLALLALAYIRVLRRAPVTA